jgi:hypothetical protein
MRGVNRMNTITLSESEQHFAKELARKRIEYNQKQNTINTPYNSSLEQVMEIGVSGEIGFCKLYNIFPSLEFDNYDGCEFDAYLHGKKVEVKTNTREDGWLGVKDTLKLDRPPDYFALMIASNLPTMGFAGFISSSSILNPYHYVNSKKLYHPLYVAYQNELIPELPDFRGEYETYTSNTTTTEGQIPTEEIWDYSSSI